MRYFIDLTPQVALIAAVSADRDGNLYTGPNTEDTPTVVEATAFKDGIVIAQVDRIVDKVPRVDIPGDRVHFVVEAGRPFYVEPLFTRDPAAITETQILTAMLAIKGIYAPYGIKRLNHGIGFNTAAIELLLPTYGEARAEGQGLLALGAQSAPDADSRDRVGLGRADPLLRLRKSGWTTTSARVPTSGSRNRRVAALEPRVLPDRRPLCVRHVHRLDAADRPVRPFVDGHGRAYRRFRRRAEHGQRRARPAPSGSRG